MTAFKPRKVDKPSQKSIIRRLDKEARAKKAEKK